MDYYKGNSLANFTTRLPNAINLTGDWEVGLVEIQYPHNWYNVPEEESCRTFRVRCQSADNENGATAGYDFLVPSGYYHRVQTLLNQIEEKANHVLKSTNNTINLNYVYNPLSTHQRIHMQLSHRPLLNLQDLFHHGPKKSDFQLTLGPRLSI